MTSLRPLLAALLFFAGIMPARADDTTLAFNDCNAEQQAELASAITGAKAAVNVALTMIDRGAAERYLTAWFGNIEPTRNSVVHTLTLIQDRLNRPDTMVFACEERNCESDLVGYVHSGAISVCPDFFAAAGAGVYDSQAGTIIHELSHSQAQTHDHAYGTNDARRLAAEKPQLALENADNFQYFVESVTGLIPYGDQAYSSANSCRWAYDGDCDERGRNGGVCKPGTDSADCQQRAGFQSALSSRPRKPTHTRTTRLDDTCPTARNGQCDEAGGGGNDKCRTGSDSSDCRPQQRSKQPSGH